MAISGGGECIEGETLIRSRPFPDTDGSTPTGWIGSCTAGLATSYAMCVPEDFKHCRTERVDGVGSALVSCPSGQTVLSAGGYCEKSPPGLLLLELDPDLTRASVACVNSTVKVYAYAICCG